MRRALAAFGAFLLILAVGACAGLLWLALHPTSPLLERVARWPGLGPVAEVIRSLAPPERVAEEAGEEPGGEREEALSLREEAAAASGLPRSIPATPDAVRLGARGRLWVTPGTRLLAAPRDKAREITVFSLYTNLVVIERRPGWAKVRFRDETGWVVYQEAPAGPEPPLGSAPDPVLPLPARPPDPERLARARARLTPPEAAGQVGPYPLYTDVRYQERLRLLDRVAGQAEELYRSRYGREPMGQPAEVVLLYSSEVTFRAFLDEEAEFAGVTATGHSGYGIIAFYDGGRSVDELGATLLHELAHLLNRRALGPMLPSWLDEGIATDLAGAHIGADGTLDPAALGGATLRSERLIRVTGAKGGLQHLVDAAADETLRPLPELLALDWDGFVRRDAERNYPHAAFWIRYLLEGEDGALAPGFRAFLASVAAGGPPSPEALRERLGRSWEELETGFRAWLPARNAMQ